jgi:hypothetical protein
VPARIVASANESQHCALAYSPRDQLSNASLFLLWIWGIICTMSLCNMTVYEREGSFFYSKATARASSKQHHASFAWMSSLVAAGTLPCNYLGGLHLKAATEERLPVTLPQQDDFVTVVRCQTYFCYYSSRQGFTTRRQCTVILADAKS